MPHRFGVCKENTCNLKFSLHEFLRRGVVGFGVRLGIGLALSLTTLVTEATTILANPQTYLDKISSLKPGDILRLAPGTYLRGLPLHGLIGEVDRPITIEGEAPGVNTIFLGRTGANTVSIKNTAHVVVRSLLLDGRGLDVDAVKAEGTSRFAHHITLENLTIVNHGSNQQIVGISTKCPAWGWIIRGNVIRGAGTGMYFGDSDGTAPFIGGLIEHNLIMDTIGYNLQIKHQVSRPAGMPFVSMRTVIRNNVFSKVGGNVTKGMARPNVLLGHFPLNGLGAEDEYLVYGNFFYENRHEALFQTEGNAAIHGNIFFNSHGSALRVAPHKALPRRIEVVHNTVIARDVGIVIAGGDTRFDQLAVANAVFAAKPIIGGMQQNNISRPYSMAAQHLWNPMTQPGRMDFSPRADYLDLMNEKYKGMKSSSLLPSRVDFFGRQFGRPTAGAIASGWVVPWLLDLTIQPVKP